ncbi:MAG TPA: SufE family protein [Caulobacteraceae bacterium]|jgi:cysteine desulfuration protein SufE
MNTILQELDELADEFDMLGSATDPKDWEERYRYVIELGRTLEPLTDAERTDANKVRGCASQVWLVTERLDNGRLSFRGDSDAHIVSGLIAILLRLYSKHAPDEILAFDAKAAFARLGLAGALSQQRSNGLFSMVERIRRDASAAAGAAA